MKFMIAVDCEGSACVVGEPGRSLSNSRNMEFAREQATRETNAAIRALFDAGAQQVVVWDNHGDGANLVFDQLDQRCELLLGFGFGRRFPELDETYAGVLMIGYHAMAGTANAVLAHTYSSDAHRAIYVNGLEVGEIALDASVAGELGVPLIFVSSDDKGCEEALPWIETVATKRGLGRNCAYSKHPVVAETEIYEAVFRAVEQIAEKKPFTFECPVQVEIQFERFVQLVKARIRRRSWSVAGMKTLRTSLPSMLQWKC
jgi:D-amino peptidase